VIVDAHNHVFPPLAGPCGFPTEADHRFFLQLYVGNHGEPARRLRDHAAVPEANRALFDGRLEGPEGVLAAANFRVGRFGRFEWEWEGETYYRPFLPPSLQGMVAPAEFVLQSMARAGVDRALLQNARPYGRLNDDFAAAVRAYPDRLIGLADVKESEAHGETELAELKRAVCDLGLRGVYYANRGLIHDRYRHGFDDPLYEPFWECVRALGIPVFWELQGVPRNTPEAYLAELDRLDRWCGRHPEIGCVLTHGITPEWLTGNLADPIARLCRREQLLIEILYPIHWGREHDYPYLELRPTLARLYDRVGPDRLVWGSDMPNVERNCTYRQSLDYLRHGLAGIASAAELDAILGQNVLRVLGLGGTAPTG
jgi:predicted TIM-barrel fold metal-dependent hydrolase